MINIIIAIIVGLFLGGMFTDIVDRIERKQNDGYITEIITENE
jgi:hypothetical protein